MVESLAHALRASGQCELYFSSFYDIAGTLNYLNSNPRLADTPLVNSRSKLTRRIDRDLYGLSARLASAAGAERLLLRFERKALYTTSSLLSPLLPPLDPASLAQADIFHSPFVAIPAQARRAPRLKRFLTVFDLSPIIYPQYSLVENKGRFTGILDSLKPEDWAICISNATKDDLCRYLRFDPAHVFVTYLAADRAVFFPSPDIENQARVRLKYGIPPGVPYFLTLSAIEPRKNLDHVVRTFARFVQAESLSDLHLVLAGPRVRDYDSLKAAVEEHPDVESRIVFTGFVDDADLAPLYSGALAFLYLSLYEGFGLPLLEAMQCGLPVIASNTSAMPEVAGDAALLVDPKETDELCDAMLKIYTTPSLRDALTRRGMERAELFSWETCANQTLQAYQTALKS